jgi:NADPH2:quinone reductase
MELVLREGAHHVLDHHDSGRLAQVRELTGGRGADIIVEMLANANLADDLSLLALGGRVVIVGCRGAVQLDPREIMRHEAAVLGMLLFNVPEPELASLHAAIAAGLELGTLRPVVSRELPVAQAAAAHEAIMSGSSLGKVVLVP